MIAVTVDAEFHLLVLSIQNDEYRISIRTNSLAHGISMLNLQARNKYLSYMAKRAMHAILPC